ncbi:MAG: GNAT family N-acetyltransferase [Anaerolineales bacterium]|nr:GNAT family N-acetyltransferase [Anaerolineales bacterium]
MTDLAEPGDQAESLPAAWSSVVIRDFSFPQDYPAVYHLWEEAGAGVHLRRSDELQEIHKKLQRDPDLFLLAEIDDELVGSVLGGFDGRRGMVYHLAVSDGHRRLGIGTLLMDELEMRLRAKGCIRCYLLVARDNLEAIRFYEGQSWKRMDDLYAYAKDLD